MAKTYVAEVDPATGEVINVIVCDEADVPDDAAAQAFCEGSHSVTGGPGTQFRVTYKEKDPALNPRRKYAEIGGHYLSADDIFAQRRPRDLETGQEFLSWALNKATGLYEPPIPAPANQDMKWDETARQWVPREAGEVGGRGGRP